MKLIDMNGKVVAAVITYTGSKEIEINLGTYKVSIQALSSMKGLNTKTEIENIIIKGEGDTTPISYDFKTGNFEIFTKVGNENADAVVTLKEVNTDTNVAGVGTYNRRSKVYSQPR